MRKLQTREKRPEQRDQQAGTYSSPVLPNDGVTLGGGVRVVGGEELGFLEANQEALWKVAANSKSLWD